MNETGTHAPAGLEGDRTGEATRAVTEAAARARLLEAEPGFPRGYVDQVRAATGWLGVASPDTDDVRHAALLLNRQAAVDLSRPMAGWGRTRRLVKRVVRRLLGWYDPRFLLQQVAAIGQDSARLGLATARRLEGLEAHRAALEDEIALLRARMAHLEAALPGAGAPSDPPAGGTGPTPAR
ncbi:MAG: hypothetical protein ACRD0O_16180 [Acidimicrobiia bacterium]